MAKRKPSKPKKAGPGRPRTFTDAQLKEQIELCAGVLADVAQRLGVTRMAIQKRMDGNDELKAFLLECRKDIAHMAESKLLAALKLNEPWAIKLILQRLGHFLGYSNTVKLEGELTTGKLVITLPDDGRDGPEPDDAD